MYNSGHLGMNNFSSYHNHRDSYGGGAAVYVSDDFKSKYLSIFDITNDCMQSIGTAVSLTNYEACIISVYRPPKEQLIELFF